MTKKYLFGIFILLVMTTNLALARDGAGRFVFAIRTPYLHRDGFRAATGTLERGRGTTKWWEFYQYDIGVMSPIGTDFRQLTDDGLSRRPRWSPDGSLIAYISGIDEAEALYVMKADGAEKARLVKKQYRIHDFRWSPRGDTILVVVEIDRPRDRLENWVVTVDGKSTKHWRTRRWAEGWFHWDVEGEKIIEPKNKLLDALPKGVKWPEWSPDRKWIAFTADGFLALAQPEVVGMTGLWFLQRDEPPCQRIERWSPDGRRILFYASGDICIAAVENGKFKSYRNLSLYRGRDATWSPDGGQVGFIGRDRGGRTTSEVFIIDVETGAMEQITSTSYDFFNLHWH